MKKILLLGFILLFQTVFSQTINRFENKIKAQKTITKGCLTNYFDGPFPEETFTPSCDGREEQIFTAAMHSTYSNVKVTANVEYTFIVYPNDPTNTFITISNEAGTEIYASGYDLINWTPSKDEVVRYYVHLDDTCTNSNYSVKKYIRCGAIPPEPEYNCDQSYDGPFWAGCSVSGDAGYLIADDFFIPKDSEIFKLKTLKYLIVPLIGKEDFKNFTIEIREDKNNSPGEIIKSYENITATEVIQHTETFLDYPTFWTTLTIPNGGIELPVNKEENSRYWVTIQVWSKVKENIAVAGFHRINGWATAPTFQSLDNRETWITTTYEEDPGLESIWSFDADCSKLTTQEFEKQKVSIYPNPVKDYLKFTSKKSIKELSILTYTGEKLMTFKEFKDNQINLSNLKSGNYLVKFTLENGVIEASKIIKK